MSLPVASSVATAAAAAATSAASKTANAASTRQISTSLGRSMRLRRATGVKRGFIPRGQRPEAAALRERARQRASMLRVPKLPHAPTAIVPKPLKPLPPKQALSSPSSTTNASSSSSSSSSGGGGASASSSSSSSSSSKAVAAASASRSGSGSGGRWREWLRQNTPVLILNFGSLCTLTGFTRNDVLELRALSMTGSLSSVIYFSFNRPMPWTAMAWSSIFALTNAYNIYKILDERGHRVVMNDQEEELFVEHFMPHGLTPKQFKKVMAKAERVVVTKGTVISKQGTKMDSVYLVVRGNTRGSAFGRRISAASSVTGNRDVMKGGDSGAWIGEIEFLELLWQRHNPSKKALQSAGHKKEEEEKGEAPKKGAAKSPATTEATLATVKAKDSEKKPLVLAKEVKAPSVKRAEDAGPSSAEESPERQFTAGRALYTIVAEDECELAKFKHSDLVDLMESSSDMRAAMTRAMTAVVVGRVVNFTVSRSAGSPTWSTWLNEWKHSGGASVNVRTEKIADAIRSHVPY